MEKIFIKMLFSSLSLMRWGIRITKKLKKKKRGGNTFKIHLQVNPYVWDEMSSVTWISNTKIKQNHP